MIMRDLEILKLFNAMVVSDDSQKQINTSLVESHGVFLDFEPNDTQKSAIKTYFEPLDVRTLFSREERENSDLTELITKQFLHYLQEYGVTPSGLFDLEVTDGKIVVAKFVQGITVKELETRVKNLIYKNVPVSAPEDLVSIIRAYNIPYDINLVQNNEIRVMLFDVNNDVFTNGDDAVRWICWMSTGSPLLIKSEEVIAEVKNKAYMISGSFLARHASVLANVFNRHKRIILACKANTNARSAINHISRLSKKLHVPVIEPVSKRMISLYANGNGNMKSVETLSLRDCFKLLNLIRYKQLGKSVDAFIIRNGKVHVEENRKLSDEQLFRLEQLEKDILSHLKGILSDSLKGKTILLEKDIRYGLPVSRKQCVGNLPYGTEIRLENRISAGIYWKNSWGATDLDLSTVDTDGDRVGWGVWNGYWSDKDVKFSGDIVNAPNGAMEFMSSSNSDYGLFVNVYDGEDNPSCELVVGSESSEKWIKTPLIREKFILTQKEMLIGFVHGTSYIVYAGTLGGSRVSGSHKAAALASRGLVNFWTINELFSALDIDFSVDKKSDTIYDHDMSYEGFSFDRLEEMLSPA